MQEAGFGDSNDPRQAIYMSCLIAGANAAFTVVALFLVDRVGRRPLLLGTIPGVTLGLASLGFTFFAKDSSNDTLNSLPIGVLAMSSMTIYIAFFATGTHCCCVVIYFYNIFSHFFFFNIVFLIIGLGPCPWYLQFFIYNCYY